MNSPAQDFDRQKLHELASAAIDGTGNEEQLCELTRLLQGNAAARDEYLMLMDLHAALSTELVPAHTSQAAIDVNLDQSTGPTPPLHRNRVSVATIAALAACLLIAVTWLGTTDTPIETDSFVTVAQTTDAVWESELIDVGNHFGATTIRLRSGFVRLEFDSGVEVTLEGPAEFKMLHVAKTELKSGLLTATVPPGAEGFTVNTPTAEVVDLGTSFGIDLRNDGASDVSVFDGEVEIAPRDATEKLLLSEGESVRIGVDYEIEDVRFDPKPFEKVWPIASGIVGSSETLRFVPPWPRQIRFIQSDNDIFIRPEGHPVELSRELKVNISDTGTLAKPDGLSPTALQAGNRVRSYILHYSPKSQLGPRRAKRMKGSITFSHPVLGIIVCHEELLASSRRFRRRGAGEGNHRRELNLTGDDSGDQITLSEDRKTVELDLISPGRSSDLVRVIVDSSGFTPRPRRIRQEQNTKSTTSK